MSDRPLPRLRLPAAILRYWRGDLSRIADEMATLPGVEHIGESLLALVPTAQRADLFHVASALSSVLLRRQRKQSPAEQPPAVLVFPGRVLAGPGEVEPLRDSLFDDLLEEAPRLTPGGITFTGRGAAWLRGRFELKAAGSFDSPSGRRVPLFEWVGDRVDPRPWHQADVLGRRLRVPRPELDGALVDALGGAVVRVFGGLGVGKTRAVHAAIELAGREPEAARLAVGLGETLPGLPILARSVMRWLVETAGSDGFDLRKVDHRDPDAMISALAPAFAAAREHFGAPPRLVVDRVDVAEPVDLELLDGLAAVAEAGDLRLVRVGRSRPVDDGFPERVIEVPPLDGVEMDTLIRRSTEGLEVPEEVVARLLDAAAGRPLMLEEMLWHLVHRGQIRRVYGSFFFAGDSSVEAEPSERLVRHVEAEARRLGDPLPLRILAHTNESIYPHHLEIASEAFGVVLDAGWQQPWLDAGWLQEQGDGAIEFSVPAIGRSLADAVTDDGARSLRHALGTVLATSESGPGWTAYRLMAGTPEALPSLLDSSRDPQSGGPSREEVFNALWEEYREHRARHGDRATELEILWALLPLARRLGCLAQLRRELERGVELARDHEQRWVALVALRAELDQERGDFRAAEAGLREALAGSAGFGEGRRATLFLRLGALLHRQERWSEARAVFTDLLSVVDAKGPTGLGATCQFYLGNVALGERRLDAAEEHHRAAETVRRDRGLHKALGSSLCALGAVAAVRGDFPTALSRHQDAEAVLADAGAEPPDFAYALLGKGRALTALGDLRAASKTLRQALEARQGRDDLVGEAIARLDLAAVQLELGRIDACLEETRRACFHLGLVPETALLGDAERLLGRILLRQRESDEARAHLETALRIHGEHGDAQARAEDHAWLLELAILERDRDAVHRHALELERLLEALSHPIGGERLDFRLYRAFRWLAENDQPVRDAEAFLRRSYKELMRKTAYLEPARRQPFLYQIPEHQEILDAAADYQISIPIFTVGGSLG